MDHKIVELYFFLPCAIKEEKYGKKIFLNNPNEIVVQDMNSKLILLAKKDIYCEYRWNIYDEYESLLYSLYKVKIPIPFNHELYSKGNIPTLNIKIFIPNDYIKKIGFHNECEFKSFPYVSLEVIFNDKMYSFDENINDFTPRFNPIDSNDEYFNHLYIKMYRFLMNEIDIEINIPIFLKI